MRAPLQTDAALLASYSSSRDAEAFAQLAARYSQLVYGICMRITRSAHDAEDLSQECFLKLAEQSGMINVALPGWLHSLAWTLANNASRASATRRRHEEAAMRDAAAADEVSWDDVSDHVDDALAELPEDLRDVLVSHFLLGKTQQDTADILGIDQSTVSRRLEKGISELREKLRKVGVVVSVALLATLLTGNAASAAVPATLTAALGKMALAGVGKAGVAASAGTTATVAAVKLKIAAVIATSVVAAVGVVAYKVATKPAEKPAAPPPAVAQRQEPPTPKPVETRKEPEVPKKIDYSKLVLEGDGSRQDSFSLAVQAAARLMGVEADYETVYSLSTNAFAPALDSREASKEWWSTTYGRDYCIDLVAAGLGLSVRPLIPPEIDKPPEPDAGEAREEWIAKYRRLPKVRLIREAQAGGEVVIVWREWEVNDGPHGFVPWAWWGIVTEAPEDGTPPLGASLNGHHDNPLPWMCGLYALGVAKSRLSRHEAHVQMLHRCVNRIRQDGLPFNGPEPNGCQPADTVLFGLRAMDAWIGQMKKVPYCPDCGDKSHGCADCSARPTSEGAKVAARYLHKIAAEFPEAARPHLEAAASHYDRIVELLHPALTGEGGEHYRDFIGDLEKQKTHAEEVLVPVKAELAAAANDMEKVLAAIARDGLTDDDLKRLGQWGNIFGRAKIAEVADTDPAFYQLLKLETSLEPMSRAAKKLRRAMGRMEPVELTYGSQLDAVFDALASGDVPDDIMVRGGFSWDSPLWDARKARRAELAGEMRQWIEDGAGPLAGILGERNDDKLRLARFVLHEFETGGPDAEAMEVLRADADLGDFAHRIEMLDAEPWSHDRNFDLLARGIAELRPIGEWHTRTGPLAWGDAAPEHKPKVEAMLAKLDAWLAGGEDAELGELDAYPEKVWLARCLATYLRYHLASYWDWMGKGADVKREGDRVWIEGVPPERRVEGMWHFDGLPASLRAALEFRGVEAKYLDNTVFAAITGQPFRFWFADDFASCLAYTHEDPQGVIVAETLGLDYTWCDHGAATQGGRVLGDAPKDQKGRAEIAWQWMKDELDSGNPVVLFGGETPRSETASPVVVTGYDAAEGTVFFVPHVAWRPAPQWSDDDPECREGLRDQGYRGRPRPDVTTWRGNGFAPDHGQGGAGYCFFAFRDRQRDVTEREVAVAVLERAVGLGRGKLIDQKRKYRKSGLVAFDALIKSLGNDEIRFFGRTRPWSELGDWWFAMDNLTEGGFRKAASAFVRKCADGFGGFSAVAKGHLAAAAEAYDESRNHMAQFMGLFEEAAPRDEEEKWIRAAGEALGSREFRAKAADIVRRIRKAEEKAIDEIEEALLWEETVPGQVRPQKLVELATSPVEVPEGVEPGGVPSSVVRMLNSAGEDVDYTDVVASSGWAFSFRYKYDNWHWAALSVEDFLFLPTQLGYERKSVSCKDREAYWDFVVRNTDAGLLSVCTHIDGGPVYGYRTNDGVRQIWFDGHPGFGWIRHDEPHPMDDGAVFECVNEARPRKAMLRDSLAAAVKLASPHEEEGSVWGIAGLEAYLADVEDPDKNFDKSKEWFCWATFERLTARRCAAEWLRRAANDLGDDARPSLLAAAGHYLAAADLYLKYRKATGCSEVTFAEKCRSPEQINVIAPILRAGIEAEKEGIEEMKKALGVLGG